MPNLFGLLIGNEKSCFVVGHGITVDAGICKIKVAMVEGQTIYFTITVKMGLKEIVKVLPELGILQR